LFYITEEQLDEAGSKSYYGLSEDQFFDTIKELVEKKRLEDYGKKLFINTNV
jgi:hypothetical protein